MDDLEEDPVDAFYRMLESYPPPRQRRRLDLDRDDNTDQQPTTSGARDDHHDVEVDDINAPLEIVPVRTLQVNNDSDERYDSACSDHDQQNTQAATNNTTNTNPSLSIPSTRMFSPDGTEFITPANSPPVPEYTGDIPDITDASDLARYNNARHQAATSSTAQIPRTSTSNRDNLDFSFPPRDPELSEPSNIKFYKPYYAKATEEDELRKIQALEDEIMSGKSLDSENEAGRSDDARALDSADSLDYKNLYGIDSSDVRFPVDDVMFRPSSVPSVEYHEDTATPVPGGRRQREAGSDHERRSNHSQTSSRPDDVPQLVLTSAPVKTYEICSNDEGEADDEDTHRSDEDTPVPSALAGISPTSILFPDLKADILASRRDPCDDIMNRIDNELLVINEDIERAHSPDRHLTRLSGSQSQPRLGATSSSPSLQRRSPYGRRLTPSPQRDAPTTSSQQPTTGTYLRNHSGKSKQAQFDEASVRTEDFTDQFQGTIVPAPKSTARSVEARLPKSSVRDRPADSDLESVQTEDFMREYRKTMVPTVESGLRSTNRKPADSDVDSVHTDELERQYRDYLINEQKYLLENKDDRPVIVRTQLKPKLTAYKPPQGPRKYRDILKAYRKRGWDSANHSEVDTARTDDYDYGQNRSPSVNSKHVAGVPLECFDEILVDSDVDTVRSAEVRNKFKSAMAHSRGRVYTPSEVSEEDAAEKKYRDYIARKLTEISRLPRIDASASDIEKQELEEEAHQLLDDDEQQYDDESDACVLEEVLQQSSLREVSSPHYDFYDQDDLTSQDEEVKHSTSEIHRESRRIAREMEDERRKRILAQHQQQARVAKSLERQVPVKATEQFSAKSPDRRGQPIRSARSLDRLSRTPPKSPDVRRERPRVESIERAVFAKEIKEKLVELQVLADTVDEAKQEKRVLIGELRGLRDAYNDSQNEIKLAGMHAKDSKTKSDEMKTELTVLEYKRDQAQQELEDTDKNLANKKRRLEELDQHVTDNLERLKDFEELGMTADQVKGIMNEKDKLKSEVGKQEAVTEERDLLKDKLLATKEELYEAEKRSRNKIDCLEEKFDISVKHNQDLQTDKSYLQQQLRMLDEKHEKSMLEKDCIIREKEHDYDSLHRNLQAELNDLRQEALVDTSRLKQEIEGLQVRTMALQEDQDEKNDENTKLRDQILDLQCDLNRETELREKENQEHRDSTTRLEVEKDSCNADIRERLYAEKQCELQETYDLFEQERRELAAKQESRLSEQLAHHHQELIARDEENQMLREQVRLAEDTACTAEDKAHRVAKAQLDEDLEDERQKWEAERDRVWKLELAKISGESVRAVQHAREDAEREKDICQHLEKQIEIVKQELEEQRQANRQSYKDKLDSMSRLKENAREEREVAIERTRNRAIDEGNREIERIRVQMEVKDEEIKRLKAVSEHAEYRERDAQVISEKHDKTVIHEINDDCKKTAIMLGVTPRKAVPTGRRARDVSPTRNAVHAALANLRACNEQLRGYVLELRQEIDNQRAVMVNIQREKEELLGEQKEKLTSEKTAEMDMLRERLIKDHMEELIRLQERSPDKAMKQALIDKDAELREIQRNMNVWKEEVAEKFAKKFEEELSRELEKRTRDLKRTSREKERSGAQQQREIERLEREVTRLSASAATHHDDSETIKLLRHLQNRVKELRTENNHLKRSSMLSAAALDIGTGVPDCIRSMEVPSNRTLENRIKQAELRAELAEERATRNEQLLNTKISEISRLQSALTHQTKEVMQLERAYKSLQGSPIKR